jgi:tripartite-type tricarboxylate transporter receptor subunit TctC
MPGSLTRRSFAAILGLAAATRSFGATYPDRSVRIIVPYGTGGISDIAARIIGNKLAAMWKQGVIVDNRPGGAGAIGTGAVASAVPDGYTLLLATGSEFTVTPHLSKQPYEVARDFVPLALLTDTPLMLVANANAPFNNVRELVAHGKAQGGGVSFASPGVGSLNHLAGEHFGAATGVKMVHIPYKSGAQAVAAVVSGEVSLGVSGVSVVKAQIESGRLKPLGLAAEQRLKSNPQWPTMIEAGLPGFVASNWVAMAAPTGIPADIAAKINADINEVLQMEDVRSQLVQSGAEPVGGKPEILAARIRVDSDRYRKLIQSIKLKLD